MTCLSATYRPLQVDNIALALEKCEKYVLKPYKRILKAVSYFFIFMITTLCLDFQPLQIMPATQLFLMISLLLIKQERTFILFI